MSENKPLKPQEDPRERFRRLLDEAEKTEQIAAAAYDFSEGTTQETIAAETKISQVDRNTPEQGEDDVAEAFVPISKISYQLGASEIDAVSLQDTHPSETDHTQTKPRTNTFGEPPPPLGNTPQTAPPALDTRGMPLPRRVDEIDTEATQVSPIAYQTRSSTNSPMAPGGVSPIIHQNEPSKAIHPSRVDWSSGLGCILRMAILGIFASVILFLITGSFMLYQYYSIVNAEDWPDAGSTFSKFCEI